MNSKQGYGKVESHSIFTKWKRKWIVLKDSEIYAEKKITLFKNEKNKRHYETISLENIMDIKLMPVSDGNHGIILLFKDESSKKFIFTSEIETKEWFEQFNLVCFGAVIGKEFKETLEDENEHQQQKPDIEEKCNDDKLLVEKETFVAFLQPSAKLNISGDCNLEVTLDEIKVFQINDSNDNLVSWPIRSLRRFGFDAATFTFEAGRRCDTGEGMFAFKTKDGERINHLVQTHAQQLATLSRSLVEPDNNENEEFEFRPLPEIPPE